LICHMLARRLHTSLGKSFPLSLSAGRRFTLPTAQLIPFRSNHSKVTLEQAMDLPRHYNELPNNVLISAAIEGDQEAIEERLIREIMSVESMSWDEAQPIFLEMVEENRKGLFMITLPYKIGVFGAVTAGIASIPLCFHLDTVLWFNERCVTTEVPGAEDLETFLEVGSWAWNWMEPPLGQVSFFLLCMQYARSQLQNLDMKPYTAYIKSSRAKRLCQAYPKYSPSIVKAFSMGDSFSGGNVNSIS